MSAVKRARLAKFGKGQVRKKRRMGQGRNVCGLKGGWQKASSPSPGKAVRENRMPPMKHFLQGSGGRNGETRKGSSFLGGSAKRERDKRRKGDGHGKIKFSIRMDEELVRTADAYVQEGMALSHRDDRGRFTVLSGIPFC